MNKIVINKIDDVSLSFSFKGKRITNIFCSDIFNLLNYLKLQFVFI